MSVGLMTDLAMHVEAYSQVGLTQGLNLFGGVLPDGSDNAVALLRFAGPPPEYVFGRAAPSREFYGVQCLVRHADYATGELWAFDAYAVLQSIVNTTINNGPRVVECKPSNAPAFVGYTDDGLCLFSANFELSIEPDPAAYPAQA